MNDPDLEEILAFFREYFDVQNVKPDTELMTSRVLDSMKIVELLEFLKQRFDVSIPPPLISAEGLGSPERILKSVKTLAASKT